MSLEDWNVTKISYSIPITEDQLDKIVEKDRERQDGEKALYELLDKLEDVWDVDYDGHFGLYIYLAFSREPTEEQVSAVETIMNYLELL